MELPSNNLEHDIPTEESIDYEAIRQELIAYKQKEKDQDVPTGHLLNVELEHVSEQDLLFWKRARELANRVKDANKQFDNLSEVDFWVLYDEARELEEQWESDYYHKQQLSTSEGRFVAFMANSVVVVVGYMSLIENHRQQWATEDLVRFKQAQSDPKTEHPTAYLAEARIEDLSESDLRAHRLLRAVEASEEQLQEVGLLELGRKYAHLQNEELVAHLDKQSKQKILDYVALSNRLHDMWRSWSDPLKLDKSRLEFYEYLANKIQAILGHQSLA